MRGLARDNALDALLSVDPSLDWGGAHAALLALATDQPIVTVHPERYKEFAVETVAL